MTEKASMKTPKTDVQVNESAELKTDTVKANTDQPTDESTQAAAVSAVGLPVDEFHGKGGTYVIENGVRKLVE